MTLSKRGTSKSYDTIVSLASRRAFRGGNNYSATNRDSRDDGNPGGHDNGDNRLSVRIPGKNLPVRMQPGCQVLRKLSDFVLRHGFLLLLQKAGRSEGVEMIGRKKKVPTLVKGGGILANLG